MEDGIDGSISFRTFFILLKICSDHRTQYSFFSDIQNIDYTGKTVLALFIVLICNFAYDCKQKEYE